MSREYWRVPHYMDEVRLVKRPGGPAHYFDTEREAREYVITRAANIVKNAEAALKKARARLARAQKKFGGAA